MSTPGNICLICNAVCTSLRNTYQIFNKETTDKDPEEIGLQTLLEDILDKEIKEDTVHTKIVCKKCYKLIDEYDELKSRINDIKNDIYIQYTTNFANRDETVNHLETIEDAGKNVTKSGASLKVVKGGNLPKKILDIPSSDEEYPHAGDDVEMADFHQENESSVAHETDMVENVSKNVIIKNVQNFPAPTFVSVKSELSSEEYSSPQQGTIKRPTRQTAFMKDGTKFVIQVQKPQPKGKTVDGKPNILKKKLMTTSNGTVIQEVEKKEEIEELNKTTLVPEGPPFVSRVKEEQVYTCLLCAGDETVAGEARAIIEHIKEQHNARLYICDICGDSFTKRQNMTAHMNDHVATEEGDFQCEACNRIFSNLRLFRIHKRMHNPQNKSWTCETCGKRYSSRNLLEEHLNIHLGVRPYVCQTCNKDFTNKYALKSHERIHETRPRDFECPKCGKTFLTHSNLAAHEKTHLPPVKEFNCNFCDKQFTTIHGLEIHSVVHTGYRPFVCGVCGKAFSRKGEIKDHERIHTGERPFQCEFCGATFSQRSNLQSHKRATHYEERRHSCSECGKCFKRRRLLDYHLKSAHTGERPFKCDVCDSTFVYPEHFKKHRRIHTGEKPYVCEVCGKAFNSRDNRNAHRFVHSDKKPYECLVCAAGFMRKPLLYHHMQLHGHINDTIVVNQPRLTAPDGQLITIEELSSDETNVTETKVFELDKKQNTEQHVVIDGKQISFVEAQSEEAEGGEGEILEEIEQVITDTESHLEEMMGGELTETETQIIETPEGPIQLVKVKIPNEHGEEEEAWIKIVPE